MAKKEPKRQLNFSLPPELIQAFEELSERLVGPKEKWMLSAIAVLRLLELPEPSLRKWMDAVAHADVPGRSFEGLIEMARGTSKAGDHAVTVEREIVQPHRRQPTKMPTIKHIR